MKKNPECVELQSRMLEYFSNPDDSVRIEIELHSQNCEVCQKEFNELKLTLAELHNSASSDMTVVPEHLLSSIESNLDSTGQLQKPEQMVSRIRNTLMLQYSYLMFMSVVIWLTLLYAQPFMNDWLKNQSLLTAVPLIDEYGLFILFFAVGGLFAMLSSPLIIRTALKKGPDDNVEKFSFRSFTSGIRFFAC